MAEAQTWCAWLLTDTPTSRRHAKLSAIYKGWLSFRGNTMAMVGLWILILLVLIAFAAPLLAPHDPFAQNLANRLQPLGSDSHILGTDSLGRDILSRLIYGSRITLYIVALVALIAPISGLLVGTVAGYAGGWTDQILMRITDIFLAFPRLVLALAFVAALGAGIENAVLAISLTAWLPYARIARAETLTRSDPLTISAPSSCRCRCVAHHYQTYLAALHLVADRAGYAGYGRHHPRRCGSWLPCSWRPTAQPGMGRDDI